MKRAVLMMALIALSNITFASTPPANGCTSISCTGTIQNIYIDNDDKIYITPPEGTYSNLSCALDSGQYFILTETHSRFKEIYGTLLAAFSAQKTVQLRIINSSTQTCEIRYVVVYR